MLLTYEPCLQSLANFLKGSINWIQWVLKEMKEHEDGGRAGHMLGGGNRENRGQGLGTDIIKIHFMHV